MNFDARFKEHKLVKNFMTASSIRYIAHRWRTRSRSIVKRSIAPFVVATFVILMLLDLGTYFRGCILSADGLKYSSFVACGRGRIEAAHYFTGSLAFDRHQDWTIDLLPASQVWLSPTTIVHPILLHMERAESDEEDTVWSFSLPIWLPLIVTTILPARVMFKWRRQSLRRRSGCCIRCGYDLRGISDRCPECGGHRAMRA